MVRCSSPYRVATTPAPAAHVPLAIEAEVAVLVASLSMIVASTLEGDTNSPVFAFGIMGAVGAVVSLAHTLRRR